MKPLRSFIGKATVITFDKLQYTAEFNKTQEIYIMHDSIYHLLYEFVDYTDDYKTIYFYETERDIFISRTD